MMKPANSQLPIPNWQSTTFLPDASNGCLTAPNGLPNGSDFCKSLQTRKVDGLTGKTPPGSPADDRSGPWAPMAEQNPTQPAIRSAFGEGGSNPVKPGQTESNHPLPSLFQPAARTCHWPWAFGTWSFSG